jgi:hypothetical protein
MKLTPTYFRNLFLLTVAIPLLYGAAAKAQSTGINYSLSVQAYSYTANLGTVIAGSPGADDVLYTIVPPAGTGLNQWSGFYYGSEYFPPGQPIYVSTNGFIALKNPGSSLPNNSLATNPYAIIAPLWDDLKVGAAGNINWKIAASSPNRRLIIEWTQMLWDHNATTYAVNMQVILYEKTNATPNVIEFKYQNNGTGVTNINNMSGGASAGLSGMCTGDYLSYPAPPGGGSPIKTSENSSLGTHPANCYHRFTPVVHPNDNCAAAEALTFSPSSNIINTIATTLHATPSAAPAGCWTLPSGQAADVWFTFTKPANLTNFEIFTDSLDCRGANYKTGIEVYTSCGGLPVACDYGSSGPAGTNASSYLNLTNAANGVPCGAQQYWVRVATDTTYKGYFRFNVRPSGRSCSYATNITPCGLPYTAPTALTTCGFGNEYDSTISACHNSFNKGEDYVFSYTPPATVCADFHVNNTPLNSFPGLFIYSGCPDVGNCLGSLTAAGGSPMNFLNVTLATGITYYFVVEYDSTNLTPCLPAFDFSITLNGTSPPVYDACANAPNVPVNTSVSATCTGPFTYYNSCATPSAAGTVPVPLCGNFTDGVTPDVWFRFTSTAASQAHTINVNPTSPYAGTAQDLCMQIYSGTCGALVPIAGACDDNSSGLNLPALTFVPPSTSTQYYIRIWSNDGTQPGNFNICAIVGCTPANDLPCNAVALTLGTPVNGDNSCSSNSGEPGTLPSCWDAGVQNTVWYKFTPAFNGSVNIRTRLFSLFDSQIAVYTGICGPGLTLAGGTNCNNDITEGCAGATRTYRHSVINGFPVTSGTTYYVRVDGRASNTGTFEILVIDATQPLPPVPVQDCIVAQTVCSNTTFTVADPGYQGIGNICDLGTGGCFVGERSSAWYIVSIQNPAPPGSYFQFSINPFAGTDYDFAVWRVDGVANYCSVLNNYTIPGYFAWFRGSWTDTYGPTGVSLSGGSGTTSLCIGAVGPPFHPAYPVTGGETFLILVSNWWGNTSGFQMDWLGTPIAGAPPVRYWQNASDSLWSNTFNWAPLCGGVPDCANQIAAVITGTTSVAPYIASSTTVKDITINIGATLRLGPGVRLDVCGDFTNNGTLICSAGSTIRFIGSSALQNINGTFSATNCFPNFTVNKATGTLKLNTHIYISGNDSIQSGVVDNNLKSTYLMGNFYNYNGATSFINMGVGAGGSTFYFTGAANQNYTNLVSNLVFNNVTVFQVPSSTITLSAGAFNNMILGTGGVLTLTAGKIVTGSLLVDITNTTAAAVTPGNTLSFVMGNLRRAMPVSTGTYEYPVGEATKGYQRFSLTYTAAPSSAHTITAKFTPWTLLPPSGPAVIECVTANWSCCAPYDNGYWTLDASIGAGVGTYTANAYPLNVSNDIGGAPNGYSIMKAVSNNGVGPWTMQGTCVTPGMGVNPVSRSALNSFSDFAVVQYVSPLPIVLLNFNAEQVIDGTVLTSWATSSEINNDHFEVERSVNENENFKTIGSVKGFGAGTTSQNHYYSLRDKEQCNGINYYRLKQVDIDGHVSYSNVVAVRCREKNDIISIYPNPSNTKINVSFVEISDGKLSLEILDMFGNIISSSEFIVKKDLNNIEMKIENLANGFYYLRLKNQNDPGETTRQVKFLKY